MSVIDTIILKRILNVLRVVHEENKELMHFMLDNKWSMVTQKFYFPEGLPTSDALECAKKTCDRNWDEMFNRAINETPPDNK